MTDENIKRQRRKLKIEKDGNDGLSIEHKEEIRVHIFRKSMDGLISSTIIIIHCTHSFRLSSFLINRFNIRLPKFPPPDALNHLHGKRSWLTLNGTEINR
jgi:hypothetical protein